MLGELISDFVIIISVPLIAAVIIDLIWMDEPRKESNLRPGECINSEIKDEDKK